MNISDDVSLEKDVSVKESIINIIKIYKEIQ